MSRHAFFIAGERVLHIANAAGAGFRYQAQPHLVQPGVLVGPHRHAAAEKVLFVRHGTLEVMVNGASSPVAAGSFVRVPRGAWFAYRNTGDVPAQLLSRTSPPCEARDSCRITIQIAAA